jgi:hypothetical protein
MLVLTLTLPLVCALCAAQLSSDGSSSPLDHLLDHRWKLTALNGAPIASNVGEWPIELYIRRFGGWVELMDKAARYWGGELRDKMAALEAELHGERYSFGTGYTGAFDDKFGLVAVRGTTLRFLYFGSSEVGTIFGVSEAGKHIYVGYLRALEAVRSFRASERQLDLLDGDKVVISYQRID